MQEGRIEMIAHEKQRVRRHPATHLIERRLAVFRSSGHNLALFGHAKPPFDVSSGMYFMKVGFIHEGPRRTRRREERATDETPIKHGITGASVSCIRVSTVWLCSPLFSLRVLRGPSWMN